MINMIKKKIMPILLAIVMTFMVIVNDYTTACAASTAEAFLVEALLSFVVSMVMSNESACILPSSDVMETLFYGSSDAEALQGALDKLNDGSGSLSIRELELLETYRQNLYDWYKEIINDIVSSGYCLDEDDALNALLRCFGADGAKSSSDVINALNVYIGLNESLSGLSNINLFSVVNDTLAISSRLAGQIYNDVVQVISKYKAAIDKKIEGVTNYNGFFYGSTEYKFDYSSSVEIPSGSELEKLLLYLNDVDHPYVVNYYPNSESQRYLIFFCDDYYRNCSSLNGYTLNMYVGSTGYINPYLGIHNVSSSSPYHSFYYADSEGVLTVTTNTYAYQFSKLTWVIYYNKIKISESSINLSTILSKYNITLDSWETSHKYGSEMRAPEVNTDLGIDLPTADVPAHPIDNLGADDYIYVNKTFIDDIADSINNLRSSIDNLAQTDDEGNVIDNTQIISDSISGSVSNAITEADAATDDSVKEIVESVPVSPSISINNYDSPGLTEKFPFCIPFDLISLVGVFDQDPVVPYIEIPFKFERLGIDETIVIDLSNFETVASICRWVERIGFIGFLIIKTRDLIRG